MKMNSLKKVIGMILVLTVLAAALVLPVSAKAGKDVYTVSPGKTVYVTFEYKDIYGIDGDFSYTDANSIIKTKSVSHSKELTGAVSTEKAYLYVDGTSEKAANTTITFAVTIAATAKVGQECKISFEYELADKDGNVSDYMTDVATIKVVAPGSGDSGTTRPPVVTNVDYTELLRQIEIAEGLKKADYTADSWANLEAALKDAYDLKTSNSQAYVDAGAKALADAIADLVLMDYSKLLEAIDTVTKFIEDDELGAKWAELYAKILAAKELLTSGDQAAVDAAAAELTKLYQEMQELIKQYLEDNKEIIEVPVEVPVEKLPEGDYCNISIHQLWPILFAISAILNVGFIAVIVIYFVRKKKNQKDETPLVDYDIDDDKI